MPEDRITKRSESKLVWQVEAPHPDVGTQSTNNAKRPEGKDSLLLMIRGINLGSVSRPE